jgi:hypothetical protein
LFSAYPHGCPRWIASSAASGKGIALWALRDLAIIPGFPEIPT